MALLNSLLNESGFPGINENAGAVDSRIKAAYEYGAAFSIDVNFWDETVDELGLAVITPIIINAFTFTASDSNITCVKKSNDTLTISGKFGETFTDAYYNFLMKDKTVKTLPMNTKEEFLALVKWSPPGVKHLEVQHTLSMNYRLVTPPIGQGVSNINAQKTFQQGVYWSYPIAVGQFQALVAKGSI